MDSFSDEVALSFRSVLNEKIINKDLINRKNKKLLVDVEGNLQIYLNNQLFFSDNNMLLLEFGVEVSKWINVSFPETDFSYYTMSHIDEPILQFLRQPKGWILLSTWQEFQQEHVLSEVTLIESLKQYLYQLQEQLWRIYRLKISDF